MAKVLDRPTERPPQEDLRDELVRRLPEMCEQWPDRRVELINGRIVVRELPTNSHNDIVFWILTQLLGTVTEHGWKIWNDIKIHLDPQAERYRPDLTVVPRNPRMWDKNEVYGDVTLLVVEVVSPSSVNDDHVVKPQNCALAGVPLYLVIDAFDEQIRLLSSPSPKGYQQENIVKFGGSLKLPEPWNLTIDTDELPEG
ncbi:Uma2 family endonuclease [Streptosporangium sp. NPDC049644]|uniref:Uma2 family endonuclease n=1 Tax=Streptosporangium sp. NPDC049644 TaxID=3155507 RepID=UPI00342EA2D8